jgi:hypothetical protein
LIDIPPLSLILGGMNFRELVSHSLVERTIGFDISENWLIIVMYRKEFFKSIL